MSRRSSAISLLFLLTILCMSEVQLAVAGASPLCPVYCREKNCSALDKVPPSFSSSPTKNGAHQVKINPVFFSGF